MNMQPLNVMNAPKTSTFQMRINPEIKARVEKVYEQSGMSLTDAINCFIQQSLNVGGLPFVVTQNSQDALRNMAITQLMAEIRAGRESVKTESDWVSEEEMMSRLGITK